MTGGRSNDLFVTVATPGDSSLHVLPPSRDSKRRPRDKDKTARLAGRYYGGAAWFPVVYVRDA